MTEPKTEPVNRGNLLSESPEDQSLESPDTPGIAEYETEVSHVDTNEAVPSLTEQEQPEDLPNALPDDSPDDLPDDTPDDTPDALPDDTPDALPDDTPDDLPDDTPDDLPDSVENKLAEGSPDADFPVGSTAPIDELILNEKDGLSGLQSLATLDQLVIEQSVEVMEVISGCETINQYRILTTQGHVLFTAIEDTGCINRLCCGACRAFELGINDVSGREIFRIKRPMACSDFCFPCCLQKMDINLSTGDNIGKIQQIWSLLNPLFSLKDSDGNDLLSIVGPCCTWALCSDVEFKIKAAGEEEYEVGSIIKTWAGIGKELFTDADSFLLLFSPDLDVQTKALIIAAAILVDYIFYENIMIRR